MIDPEALRDLVSSCPIGYHQGKLVVCRSFTDAQMIEWLRALKLLATPPAPDEPDKPDPQ